MQLAVSSAAAPDLPLADLLEGCQRRGLAAVELVVDAITPPGSQDLSLLAGRIADSFARSPVSISSIAALTPGEAIRVAIRLGGALGAPVVVPGTAATTDSRSLLLTHLAAGGEVLLLHSAATASSPESARARAALGERAGIALEVDPSRDAPAAIPAVLQSLGDTLRYVRLRGGGPEAAQQTGLGVGTLMGRLALARFAGPLVLTPSEPTYHRAWLAWLSRSGGWGCGSKQSDPTLVRLVEQPTVLQERAS
jgi:predicted secreted protein